jgi:alpha-L-fucosidase 2
MLLQSHAGLIEILPALPDVWKTGSFTGLKVVGGGEVSAKWANGKLTSASLKAERPYRHSIKLPEHFANMRITLNGQQTSLPISNQVLTVDMRVGDVLVVEL